MTPDGIDMGGIDPLPSGRFRMRITSRGKTYAGTFPTLVEALAMRDGVRRQIAASVAVEMRRTEAAQIECTMVGLGAAFLHSRAGHRTVGDDESRWDEHVRRAPFARLPVREVTSRMVEEWAEGLRAETVRYKKSQGRRDLTKTLSFQSRKHILGLTRQFFKWAKKKELLEKNPTLGLQIQKEDGDEEEGWQDTWYLDPAEQERLLMLAANAPDPRERLILAFALGTMLRAGELWSLHLADVHAGEDEEHPHVIVRYGSWDKIKQRYRSPKGRRGEKRIRRVPLFGLGLEAARAWLEVLPEYAPENALGLMFPLPSVKRGRYAGASGRRRISRGVPASWAAVVKAFGPIARIGRPPWWHLLRHTGGCSLVNGWWGERMRLEDVQKIMGHADIATTQRYAKVAAGQVAEVARSAHGAFLRQEEEAARAAEDERLEGGVTSARAPGLVTAGAARRPQLLRIIGNARGDSNPRPSASKAARFPQIPQKTASDPCHVTGPGLVTSMIGVMRGIAAGRVRMSASAVAELGQEIDRLLADLPTSVGGSEGRGDA